MKDSKEFSQPGNGKGENRGSASASERNGNGNEERDKDNEKEHAPQLRRMPRLKPARLDEYYRLNDLIRNAQRDAAMHIKAQYGIVVKQNEVVVSVDGIRYRKYSYGHVMVGVPCSTCWDDAWFDLHDDFNLERLNHIDASVSIAECFLDLCKHPYLCSFCRHLPEGTSKTVAYGRKCYEQGVSESKAEKAKLSWSESLFRRALSLALETLEEFWEEEVRSHKYLQDATPDEREEAKAVFLLNFELGLRDGAD